MYTKQDAAENKAMFQHALAFLRTHFRVEEGRVVFTYTHHLSATMARQWPTVSVERITTQINKAERVIRGEVYRSHKE